MRPQSLFCILADRLLRTTVVVLHLSLVVAVTVPAQAAFTGGYSVDTFQLINTNAEGTATSADGGLTLEIAGGNNGSDLLGMTYFLMLAPENAVISFHYSFAGDMLENDPQHPIWDLGGYILKGKFNTLSIPSVEGDQSFTVRIGDGFGFGVQTLDNWGGPGTLTISGFTATPLPDDPAVPEPAFTAPTLILISVYAARRRWRTYLRAREAL